MTSPEKYDPQKHPRGKAGKWVAAISGGAIGGIAARAFAIKRDRKARYTAILAARADRDASAKAENAWHNRRTARLDWQEFYSRQRVGRGWVVPLKVKVLFHDIKRLRNEQETLNPDPDAEEINNPERMSQINRLLRRKTRELDALGNARPPRRFDRAGHQARNPQAHQRRLRGEFIPVGYDRPEIQAEAQHPVEAHRYTRDGTPNKKGRAAIRTELRERISRFFEGAKDREVAEHLRQRALRGEVYREIVSRIPKANQGKYGRIIAAGIFGGAAAGWGAHRLIGLAHKTYVKKSAWDISSDISHINSDISHINTRGGDISITESGASLAKADDSATTPLQGAAARAETRTSKRLAQNMATVKSAADAIIADPANGTLLDATTAGINHAMEPVAEAARAGASVPVEFHPGDKIITVTMQARSPKVEEYIDAVHQSRIQELTASQEDAIQAILSDAAQSGASPQEMARRIKEGIGLTTAQAAQVANYRTQLEAGNGAALGRKLRDKRYDATVRSAIRDGRSLTPAQINAAVDAYHRRYIAYRAMTIARTEAVGAANNGYAATVADLLAHNPGYTVEKKWIATLDQKTRPDHYQLHGKTVVGLNTPFVADDGTEILWPHSPGIPANQCINCRCTFGVRLIPRRAGANA